MCQKDRITTLVCPPKIVNANNKVTSADHMMDKLVFVPTFVFRINRYATSKQPLIWCLKLGDEAILTE